MKSPKLVKILKRARVESVAISLLFSFIHPEHEQRSLLLSVAAVPLSVSHQILPEYREYERTSTVTINAYLQPLMGLSQSSQPDGNDSQSVNEQRPKSKTKDQSSACGVMQSSGGSISAAAAAAEPVRTTYPAVANCWRPACRAASGFQKRHTFDMAHVNRRALCERAGVRMTNEAVVADLPVGFCHGHPHRRRRRCSIARWTRAIAARGTGIRGPIRAGLLWTSLLPTVTDAHVVLAFWRRRFACGDSSLTKRAQPKP